jgi:hypothetical protein
MFLKDNECPSPDRSEKPTAKNDSFFLPEESDSLTPSPSPKERVAQKAPFVA